MPLGRTIGVLFLGMVLGVGLTVGAYYGVREYAPQIATRYLESVMGQGAPGGSATGSILPSIDAGIVKSIVQDVLTSEQGKAVVWDLFEGQSKETFESFFKEAMKSPEFRQALADALGQFLSTAEGKELIKRIARDALTP